MAPRLQGLLKADGDLAIALWGAGDLARLKLSPLSGPVRYGPNLAEGTDGGLFVAQSAPALLVRRG
ncbi:MAG: glycogen debranching protein, partial [Pseudomonadota bacterium]